jgi:hypothetical protein
MNQREKARAYDAQQLVQKFNNKFPVGSKVMHRSTAIKSIPFTERIVKSEAFVSNSTQAVAFFEGLSGYYSIDPEFVQY